MRESLLSSWRFHLLMHVAVQWAMQAGPNVGFMRVLGDLEEAEQGQRTIDQDEYAAQELLDLYQDQGVSLEQCREAVAKIGIDKRGIVNAMVYIEETYLTQQTKREQ